MEKNIAYPTDAHLLYTARKKLVNLAKKHGIKLRQTHAKTAKKLLKKALGYAHAKQFKRLNGVIKQLKTQLGSVLRDIERKLLDHPEKAVLFKPLFDLSNRLLIQTKNSKNKVYSLHEPQVYCVAKGKARSRYEFGCKVSLVTTHKEGFCLSAESLPTNVFDGHSLGPALGQVTAQTGHPITTAYVDQGYRGHGQKKTKVYHSGQLRNKTLPTVERKSLRRRSMIEARISETKRCGRLSVNYLKGKSGDAIGAVLCGVGHNLRFLGRFLSDLSPPKLVFGS